SGTGTERRTPSPSRACARPGLRRTSGPDRPCRAGRPRGPASGARRSSGCTMKSWLTTLAVLAIPAIAGAHPLGNFTTNRYAALTVEPQAVRVAYVVDLAELPAYREIGLVDTHGNAP